MNWETYEEVTRDIYKALGENAGVEIVCSGRNCKLEGKSGVQHQIDVLTKHKCGFHEYRTIIECKYWNETVSKDTLMKVLCIQEECNIQKSVVVSKKGFTPDALKYAKAHDIGLVILREPTDEDWEGRIQEIVFTLKSFFPVIESVQLDVIKQLSNEKFEEKAFIDDYYFDTNQEQIPMREIINEFSKFLGFDETEETKTYKREFKSDTKFVHKEKGIMSIINSISIIGKNTFTESVTKIDGKNQVWLILKAIFEEKEYLIDKNGGIKELSDEN